MHNAPSVSYPVGRSRLAAFLLAFAWLAGAVGVASWMVSAQPGAPRAACAGMLVLACGAAAVRGWLRSPAGVLAWNGEGWTLKAGRQLEWGEPECVLDLQHTMLLQWQAGGTLWLWASRSSDPAAWEALRRAVYSRARLGAVPAAAPQHEAKP